MKNEKKKGWKPFILAGGINAFLYILTAVIIPGVMNLAVKQDLIGSDALKGAAMLGFIAGNKLFWIVMQALVLETSIFLIIFFIAMVNAFNPVYEALLGIGVLLISLAVPGSSMRRYLAPLGYITAASALLATGLFPVIGYWYLWWWVFLVVWLMAAGTDLIRVARKQA